MSRADLDPTRLAAIRELADGMRDNQPLFAEDLELLLVELRLLNQVAEAATVFVDEVLDSPLLPGRSTGPRADRLREAVEAVRVHREAAVGGVADTPGGEA